ncbi:hypothetical protein D9M71_189280 [compost metagenome]
MAGVEYVAEQLDHPEHRQVLLPADVDAREQPASLQLLPISGLRVLRRGDQVVLQEGDVIVGRVAHVLLLEGLLVRAASPDKVEVLRFVHGLPLVVGWQHLLQLEEKAIVQRGLQRHRVQADTLGVAAFTDLAHQLVEEVLATAMGGDEFHRAAPGNTRVGDGPELARVRVQGELIEDTAAALAGLGVGVARHAVDAVAVGELQHVGRDLVLRIDDDLAQVLGRLVHDACPHLAVFQEEPSLQVIAAAHPLIHPRILCSSALDGGICRGPGQPDLPPFFHELQAAGVGDPATLIRQEDGLRVDRDDLGVALALHQLIPSASRMACLVASVTPPLLGIASSLAFCSASSARRPRSSASA